MNRIVRRSAIAGASGVIAGGVIFGICETTMVHPDTVTQSPAQIRACAKQAGAIVTDAAAINPNCLSDKGSLLEDEIATYMFTGLGVITGLATGLTTSVATEHQKAQSITGYDPLTVPNN